MDESVANVNRVFKFCLEFMDVMIRRGAVEPDEIMAVGQYRQIIKDIISEMDTLPIQDVENSDNN